MPDVLDHRESHARWALRPRLRLPRGVRRRGPRDLWSLPTDALGHAAAMLLGGRGRSIHVDARLARARVYLCPRMPRWLGGLALGHAVLIRRGDLPAPLGRALLAHELAHTRQADLLGPLYLPAHILAQALSFALSLALPGDVPSRVHAYNPLEQSWICIGATAVAPLSRGEHDPTFDGEALLDALGATPEAWMRLVDRDPIS